MSKRVAKLILAFWGIVVLVGLLYLNFAISVFLIGYIAFILSVFYSIGKLMEP